MNFLDIILLLISPILIALILLQERGSMGGELQGMVTEFFLRRRGWERYIFIATWVLASLFIILSILRISL